MKISIILALLIGFLFIDSAQCGFLSKLWREIKRPFKQVAQIVMAPVTAAVGLFGGKSHDNVIQTTNVVYNDNNLNNTITNNTIINLTPNSIMIINNMNESEGILRCVVAPGAPRQNLLTFEEMAPLVDNITNFAFDLLQAFSTNNTNIAFSPLFISRSLIMVYAGANGTTAEQMESVLDFGINRSIIHSAYQQYLEQYLQEVSKESHSLSVVNSLWSPLGIHFGQSYLDILGFDYNTCLRQIDFENEAEKCRVRINEWVSNETNHTIQECIPDKLINHYTSLILVTAVAFKGNFASPFDKNATKNGTFTLLNGSSIETPMMHGTGLYSYCSHDDYEAITLPYKGEQLFITFIVPNATEFDTFAATLSSDQVTDLLSKRDQRNVSLSLPKFEAASSLSLENVLKQLGMTEPFNEEADFSGMTGKRNVKLSDVFHSAHLSVEEETGTETNGELSTPVGAGHVAGQPPTNGTEAILMEVNLPFIWILHDRNDMIVLLGKQIEP